MMLLRGRSLKLILAVHLQRGLHEAVGQAQCRIRRRDIQKLKVSTPKPNAAARFTEVSTF